MALIKQLKEYSLLALKNKDNQKRAFYQLLLAEANNLAKTMKEDINERHIREAATFLKRKLQQLNTSKSQYEIELLKPFCFEELDEQELRNLVYDLKNNKQMSIGQMMKYLNSEYGSSINKSLAKSLFDIL